MPFRDLTLDDIDPSWRQTNRWRLGAALGTSGGMVVPVVEIYLHHTVSPDTGDVVADVSGPCDTDQRNFGKVSYSWNIHESTSSVIEVEGTHRGAHTINNAQQSLNGVSFGFGVIGNFHPSAPNPPPREPTDALLHLIAEAIFEKAIKPGYAAPDVPIKGHRDAPYATACCGDWLYAKLPVIRDLVAALSSPVDLKEYPMRFIAQFPDTSGYLVDTQSGFFLPLTAAGAQALIATGVPLVAVAAEVGDILPLMCQELRQH